MKKIISVILCFGFFTHLSAQNEIINIDKQTKEISKQTEEMSKKTKDIYKQTSELYKKIKELSKQTKEISEQTKKISEQQKETYRPIKKYSKPVKKYSKPVKKYSKPVKKYSKPVKKIPKPVKKYSKPTKKIPKPIRNTNEKIENFTINGTNFSFVTDKPVPSRERDVVKLKRGKKVLLSHTILKEGGDCSAMNIQLGNYKVVGNDIIFYSYWAAADKMPNLLFPYGFRKQVYTVKRSGVIKRKKAAIYIEDLVDNKNKKFFEDDGWRHKGLRYLTKKPKNKAEKEILDNYLKSVEKKYRAKFVLNSKKKSLENEVRSALKNKIQKHTKNWVNGKMYGTVKK